MQQMISVSQMLQTIFGMDASARILKRAGENFEKQRGQVNNVWQGYAAKQFSVMGNMYSHRFDAHYANLIAFISNLRDIRENYVEAETKLSEMLTDAKNQYT